MQEITQIIVPLDFGKHTDTITKYATSMASKLSAKITLVHIIESYQGYDMMVGHPSFVDIDAQRKSHAEQKMTELIERNSELCSGCDGTVIDGDVVDEIVTYCKEKNADLIIIGTHGARGLEKILLGSVAERILTRAPCPVLTINTGSL